MNTTHYLPPTIENPFLRSLSLVEIPLEDLEYVAGGWGWPSWKSIATIAASTATGAGLGFVLSGGNPFYAALGAGAGLMYGIDQEVNDGTGASS